MLTHPLVMLLTIELRIMGQPIQDGTPHHRFSIYQAVGLCHNHAEQRTRATSGGSTMVLSRLSYGFYLIGSKPLEQVLIGTNHTAGSQMMEFAPFRQTDVMASCSHKYQVCTEFGIMTGHLQAATDDRLRMVATVGSIESIVPREDTPVNISFYGSHKDECLM